MPDAGRVVSVGRNSRHTFSKRTELFIELMAGEGVRGDAHSGVTVKHRSRVAQDPTQPNLRQVHLIHSELFEELARQGYSIAPGEMGENVTTTGIDLLGLPEATELRIGSEAVLRVTGLRNPCTQLNGLAPDLMSALIARATDGKLIRKAGIMSVVLSGGIVRPGDSIRIKLPPEPHRPLERV